MTLRFIVDEKTLDLNGLPPTVCAIVVEELLDRVEDARTDGHEVCYDDELFNIAARGDYTFWQLFSADAPIKLSHEIFERAAAAFGNMRRWYETDAAWPSDAEVRVDGGPTETTLSIAWAYEQTLADSANSVACICTSGKRAVGAIPVEVTGRSEIVWFVRTGRDVENFFRWLITKTATRPDDIAALAPYAFKGLEFADQCFDGIGKMSKPCRNLIPMIVKHLSAFSDEGRRIFQGPWIDAPAQFASLGIDISDENGSTKRSGSAQAARRLFVDNEELHFWWHSKIEPHQDRIHIYPNRVGDGGKIIVGIFCRHLAT